MVEQLGVIDKTRELAAIGLESGRREIAFEFEVFEKRLLQPCRTE